LFKEEDISSTLFLELKKKTSSPRLRRFLAGRFAPLPLGEGRVREACAVQVFPAREDELANPEVVVQRGRY